MEKSFAKLNIFLKIVGFENGYHKIESRFILYDKLYDLMWFEKGDAKEFQIVGNFECSTEENTIYKALKALLRYMPKQEIADFARLHKVVVYKNIPSFAGLGGGSSNAATFLKMINKELKLNLSTQELADIAKEVGSDVPFFIYDFKAANVGGIGEIVKEFDDDIPDIKLFYPQDIHCQTPKVYKTFRKLFSQEMEQNKILATTLKTQTTKDLLKKYTNMQLNDLLKPVLKLYPEVYEYKNKDLFLSGSGSTFFGT